MLTWWVGDEGSELYGAHRTEWRAHDGHVLLSNCVLLTIALGFSYSSNGQSLESINQQSAPFAQASAPSSDLAMA